MIRSLLLASTLLLSVQAQAQEPCIQAELILMADVSSSMSAAEKEIQKAGYAAAFRDGLVLDAILGSYCGAVAVAYAEFGNNPRMVSDWTIIASDDDAEAFAQSIEASRPYVTGWAGAQTGLARAIRFAGESLLNNGITAERSIADISFDGGDNVEQVCKTDQITLNAVQDARDELTIPTEKNGWREIILNALPIIGGGDHTGTCGMDLQDYADAFVRGGAGSFTIPASSVSDLPRIVRDKIAREIG